jgi:hypothetical protein
LELARALGINAARFIAEFERQSSAD